MMCVVCVSCIFPREPNSFIVRRIRFGARLKWGINIFFSQVILNFALLDGKIDKTKQYNNNRVHFTPIASVPKHGLTDGVREIIPARHCHEAAHT